MGQTGTGYLETASFTPTHWFTIALVVLTGVIHVYSGFVEGRIPVTLAGVGFLVAVVVFLVDYRRALLYLVGIVYTAVQIPLWYVVKAGEYTTLGYVDKTIQVVLILALAYLWWRQRGTGAQRQADHPT